jgi:hypothetical protein
MSTEHLKLGVEKMNQKIIQVKDHSNANIDLLRQEMKTKIEELDKFVAD